MNKTTKAVLLSALVFPGCGHLWLKSKVVGTLLISISVICLYILLARAVAVANEISAKILSGEIPLDVSRISAAITAGLAESNQQLSLATWVLVLCWMFAIFDSYRLAKKSP